MPSTPYVPYGMDKVKSHHHLPKVVAKPSTRMLLFLCTKTADERARMVPKPDPVLVSAESRSQGRRQLVAQALPLPGSVIQWRLLPARQTSWLLPVRLLSVAIFSCPRKPEWLLLFLPCLTGVTMYIPGTLPRTYILRSTR
jgi:hypothetical protein